MSVQSAAAEVAGRRHAQAPEDEFLGDSGQRHAGHVPDELAEDRETVIRIRLLLAGRYLGPQLPAIKIREIRAR